MNNNSKLIIYTTEDGKTQVDVRFDDETVWLTANQVALLFDRDEIISVNTSIMYLRTAN